MRKDIIEHWLRAVKVVIRRSVNEKDLEERYGAPNLPDGRNSVSEAAYIGVAINWLQR